MKKIGDVTAAGSKVLPLADADEMHLPWKDEVIFPTHLKEEVFIKRLDGPLFFGNTNDFQELAGAIPNTATHVIIRMEKVTYIDQSGLYAMEEILLRLIKNNIKVLMVGLQKQPRVLMERIDIIPDLVPNKRIFDSFVDAMKYIKHNVEDVV